MVTELYLPVKILTGYSQINMNVLGIDIGYSNLKIAKGSNISDKPTLILKPAGAAPKEMLDLKIDGTESDDYIHVLYVNNKNEQIPYIAGISPDRASNWSRSLHSNYTNTDTYQSLFKAGLLLSEFDSIEYLVTGLPVNQYLNEEKRNELKEMLIGVHKVTPKRSIEVKEVKIVAQPIGGFFDFIFNNEDIDNDASILVIDPGFFSVDWVIISNRELKKTSSGTSHLASSVVLNEAAKLIAQEYGGKVSIEKLEHAIRTGKESVLVFGNVVNYKIYIEQASINNSISVLNTIKSSLRNTIDEPDIVIMVGGGVSYFQNAVKEQFNKSKLVVGNNTVFSNARGFWLLGMTNTCN